MSLQPSPDRGGEKAVYTPRDAAVHLNDRLLRYLAERLASGAGSERVIAAVAQTVAHILDAGYVRIAVKRGGEGGAEQLIGTSGEVPGLVNGELRANVVGPDRQPIGEIYAANKRRGAFSAADANDLQETGELVGALLATAANEPDLASQAEGAFVALAAVLDAHDEYATGRVQRVAGICELVGRDLGLDSHRLIVMRGAAAVYDCGNLVTSDLLLHKPGPLTAGEILAIQDHVQRTVEILRRIDLPVQLEDVRLIAAQHHERFDGSGYPLGVRGEAILPEARVLAVVDVLCAMMSERPHRPPLPAAEVLAHLRRCRGTLFDPSVVDALERNRQQVLAIWEGGR